MKCELCKDTGTVIIFGVENKKHEIPCPECGDKSLDSAESSKVSTSPNEMPVIPLPPSGMMKSAFFISLNYRMSRRAIDAYNECYAALVRTQELQTAWVESKMHSMRVTAQMENIDIILRADLHDLESIERAANTRRLRSLNEEEEEQYQLEQDRKRRAGKEGDEAEEDDPYRKEFYELMREALKPSNFREWVEEFIKDNKLEGDAAEAVRLRTEELIRDMS